MRPGDILSTFRAALTLSVNSPCRQETFCQFPSNVCVQKIFLQLMSNFLQPEDSPSNLCAAPRPSVNFRHFSLQPEDLPPTPSTFCVDGRCYINLRKHFVRPEYFPSTSVNFPCRHKTFCQHSARPRDFPSTSVRFPCSWVTFQLISVNFLCGREIRQILTTFHVAGRPSLNFCEISVGPRVLPSTFLAVGTRSINNPCAR